MKDTLTLEFADGSTISAWESFTLKEDYTDPLGSMEFTAMPPRAKVADYAERLQKGEKVSVAINNVPQATVLIETVKTKIGREAGVTFSLTCKSLLAPMFQGSVSPPDYTFRSKTDVPVFNVVLAIAKPYGFTELDDNERAHRNVITGKSIGSQGPPLDAKALKHSEMQAHEGETAYAMIARLVTRLGVCLRCSWDGKLMLSAPDYKQDASYAVVQSSAAGIDGDYFFDEIEITDTNDGQFSEATVRGQSPDRSHDTRTARPSARITSADLGSDFVPYKSTAAPFKPKIITDKHTRDRDRCQSVAKLALGLPAKKAYVITGHINGFTATTGAIWNVDTVVTVHLDALDIHSDMWILEREFHQSRKGGQSTKLTIIPKNFLVLGEVPH